MKGKLPPEAFEHYLSLGPGRSYQAVAERFLVSKRTVAARAREERWQERLERLEREARERSDVKAAEVLEAVQAEHLSHIGQVQSAIREVLTPPRVKAVVASLVKAAVQREDVRAARLLLDRLLGRPRSEPLPAVALDLPGGLETASEIRVAANALLQAVAEGSVAPEDAQKAAAVLEAARKSVETEELERRITELEQETKREGKR